MSTADLAWDRFLRAEYKEEQTLRWAPARAEEAAKDRAAAARALDALGINISVYRREQIEAALADLLARFTIEKIPATGERRGVRMVVYSPDHVDRFSPAFDEWAKTRGVRWRGTSYCYADGKPASTLEFRLVARNQPELVVKPEPRISLTSDEIRLGSRVDAALIGAGRMIVEHVMRHPRLQQTSSERIGEIVQALVRGLGGQSGT